MDYQAGVRPSSGAATSKCRGGLENDDALGASGLAAPEDGHTPL
jgi:hypothetical protein